MSMRLFYEFYFTSLKDKSYEDLKRLRSKFFILLSPALFFFMTFVVIQNFNDKNTFSFMDIITVGLLITVASIMIRGSYVFAYYDSGQEKEFQKSLKDYQNDTIKKSLADHLRFDFKTQNSFEILELPLKVIEFSEIKTQYQTLIYKHYNDLFDGETEEITKIINAYKYLKEKHKEA